MVSYAVVGGGIVGVAVARRLLEVYPDAQVTLFEKERGLAEHQTGRNSGVIHAGLYYMPGSLKATLCRRGGSLLRNFCDENEIEYRTCGKVLVASDDRDRERMLGIARRAAENGVPGIRLLDRTALRELEPNVVGVAGLHSPQTAIVDFAEVTRRLAADAVARGAHIRTAHEVTGIAPTHRQAVLSIGSDKAAFDRLIVCAGLQADRMAALAGDGPEPRIIPFRGEYYRVRPERRDLVRGLVYPIPDPRYPFLGVHVTPRVDGELLIGPNAILALSREGYRRGSVLGRDVLDIARYRGFWRFARQHWATGVSELHGSLRKEAFIAAARRYLPDLSANDLLPGPVGIRAQALASDGALVDDFRLSRRGSVVFVRNAPSPAATSALAIAEHVVAEAHAQP